MKNHNKKEDSSELNLDSKITLGISFFIIVMSIIMLLI